MIEHQQLDDSFIAQEVPFNWIIAIRLAVLRPNESDPSWCVYAGDRDSRAKHFRMMKANNCLGVCSLVPDSKLMNQGHVCEWRLRGLAVVPSARGMGIARELINAALRSQAPANLFPVWGSGRSHLARFYQSLGAVTDGAPFMVPGTGEHLDFFFDCPPDITRRT